MKIKRLEAENFRNLKNIAVDFEDVNIIYGKNAQGKTNLIEAIYLFTGARSFRGARDAEMIAFGSNNARLKIEFEGSGRNQTAEIRTDGKRKVKLNGVDKKSTSALSEEIKAVVFSPSHLMLIKGGPAERRKFADDALCQIKSNYSSVLKSYNRALLQRNIVLKDISISADLRSMLYVWDASLAKEGAKIIYQRQKYIEALTPFVKDIFTGISNGSEDIKIRLAGDFEYEGLEQAEIEKNLLRILSDNQNADILNKITKRGPHR
uniref:DNA replication/repair protein RecF n=1 Tax=Eubacterium sp. TaxID=142586 RepID=UPI004028709D